MRASNRVSVGAVVRVDDVVRPQQSAHTRRDRLLADTQMHETVHLVRPGQLADPLLERTDPPHGAEELEPDVSVEPLRRPGGH